MPYPRSPLWKQYIHFIAHSFLSMDGHWMTWDVDSSHSNSFHHCCQLKSSLLPKTKKNPRMVANMTVFPVRTSAQAPHLIYGKRKDKFYIHKKTPICINCSVNGETPSFHKVVLFNTIFKLQYLLTLRLSCLVGRQRTWYPLNFNTLKTIFTRLCPTSTDWMLRIKGYIKC